MYNVADVSQDRQSVVKHFSGEECHSNNESFFFFNALASHGFRIPVYYPGSLNADLPNLASAVPLIFFRLQFQSNFLTSLF